MAEQGKDGQFRMVIESKYKKLAKTRTEAKIFAVLSGLYGVLKLGLASVPPLVYGEELDNRYLISLAAILVTFAIFAIGSGGGKAHLERQWLLRVYVLVGGIVGTKAVLDMFNNPLARASLQMPSPQTAQPYDQAVAKLLVQKFNLPPRDAIYDVDIINMFLDVFGAFVQLASAAATTKFLMLKKQPGQTVKKTA